MFRLQSGGRRFDRYSPFFSTAKTCFKEWLEILEARFIVNDLTDDENKHTGLIALGQKVTRSLLQPSKPSQTSYENIVNALKAQPHSLET